MNTGDKVQFIDHKGRSCHQGIVTAVTTKGARVRDPRMQSFEFADLAEWFPFSAPNGGKLVAYEGTLSGPSSIEDLIRSGTIDRLP